MKIIYMGTPDFSVGALEALIASRHNVCAVVTQPDRKKGRGQGVCFSPVKVTALNYDIEVLQPDKLKDDAFTEKLASYNADIFIVAAYGKLLPNTILNMPRAGCINIHASLLPAYRGAAPIQWSIIDGQKETGVTIMKMDMGLDTGDMILQTKVEISPDETGGSLHDKLSKAGAELIVQAIEMIEEKTAVYIKQPEQSTSRYASMLSKEMGQINWNKNAVDIERLIRGLNPWPSAYTFLNGKSIKIWKAVLCDKPSEYEAGTVFDKNTKGFKIACEEGALSILSLQPEGKKKMETAEFLRGNKLENGQKFGVHNCD